MSDNVPRTSSSAGPFTVVIIGLGNIGLGYDLQGKPDQVFTHTKACLVHKGFNLLTGIDLDEARRNAFTSFTGLPAYDSLDTAGMSAGDVDLYIVSVPLAARSKVIEEVLKRDPRAVLIEKPIASTVEEAETLLVSCNRKRIVLTVNYFRYFNPRIQRVKSLFTEKSMGIFNTCICLYSGGIFNMASHYISLLLQWFGRPDQINVLDSNFTKYENDADAFFCLSFGAAKTHFIPIRTEYSIGEMDLLFERGRILLGNYGEDILVYSSIQDPFFHGYQRLSIDPDQPEKPALIDYQLDVMNTLEKILKGEDDASLQAENALETLKICEQVVHEAKRIARNS